MTYDSPKEPSPFLHSQDRHYSLSLQHVASHTTSASTEFASCAAGSLFAVCAGATVVVYHVLDDSLAVAQRHFQACATPPTASLSAGSGSPMLSSVEKRNRTLDSPRRPVPAESGNLPTSAVSPKPRSVNCLALSPEGDYLAVGEIGHYPRVLLFSVRSGASEPLSVVSEHTFAVKCLSFSPDGQFLISIGDIHDGYICLWSRSASGNLKLQASNKCTSVVCDTTWVGSKIITAGTRHLKLWEPEQQPSSPTKGMFRQDGAVGSPAPKGLRGRNILLGNLLETTFTAVVAISVEAAVAGTDRGDVAVLSYTAGTFKVQSVVSIGEPIKAITLSSENARVWICCELGQIFMVDACRLNDQGILQSCGQPNPAFAFKMIANLERCMVAVDNQRTIHLCRIQNQPPYLTATERMLLCHCAPVAGILGVHDWANEVSFLTYDTTGRVIFWDSNGLHKKSCNMAVEEQQQQGTSRNELRVLRYLEDIESFISGDKFGALDLRDPDLELRCRVKAHQTEINDVAIVKKTDRNGILAASAGRDRTVQIYGVGKSSLELVQTMDQHSSAVNKVLFNAQQQMLYSLSSDRTVVISYMVTRGSSSAFVQLRTLNFKHSPTSMALMPELPESLYVATIDKQLHHYIAVDGRLQRSVRLSDEGTSVTMDGFILQKLAMDGRSHDVAIGFSAMDKSIRIQDTIGGSTIARGLGHAENISDIYVAEETKAGIQEYTVVTSSSDGAVMLWKITNSIGRLDSNPQGHPVGRSYPTEASTPLRKVLSRSTLTHLSEFTSLPSSPATPLRNRSPVRQAWTPSEQPASKASPRLATTVHSTTQDFSRSQQHSSFPTPGRLSTQTPHNQAADRSRTSCPALENLTRQLPRTREELRTGIRNLDEEYLQELRTELQLTLTVTEALIKTAAAPPRGER